MSQPATRVNTAHSEVLHADCNIAIMFGEAGMVLTERAGFEVTEDYAGRYRSADAIIIIIGCKV
jgi:hypothetical protein